MGSGKQRKEVAAGMWRSPLFIFMICLLLFTPSVPLLKCNSILHMLPWTLVPGCSYAHDHHLTSAPFMTDFAHAQGNQQCKRAV